MKHITFEARLPLDTDIELVWAKIPHEGVTLGGRHKAYIVSYAGELHAGMMILELIMQFNDQTTIVSAVSGI